MGLRQGLRELARARVDWVDEIGEVLRLGGLGGMVWLLWCSWCGEFVYMRDRKDEVSGMYWAK